ncbi:MAG TPA: helix-turn-helix domain-containing protein [Trebonia sp.]
MAEIFGVPLQTVRKWRTGKRRAVGDGRQKRKCPRCDEVPLDESAYAYLLGLYLGDGCLTLQRKGVYLLSIACADAWPGLISAAEVATRQVMPASAVFSSQRTGMTAVKSTSKHWPCLFPQHGPGPKHKRKIELADWQQVIVDRYPGDFVRGLMHSDGYRGMNRVRQTRADGDHWYEYPRYLFSNRSKDIHGLCGAALDRLGVEWRFSNWHMISVAKRDAVARLDEFVGPKY